MKYLILFMLFCSSVFGAQNFNFACAQASGLLANISFNTPGFPKLNDVSVRELGFNNTRNFAVLPLSKNYGVTTVGGITFKSGSGTLGEWEEYSQQYNYKNPYDGADTKNFFIAIRAMFYPNGVKGGEAPTGVITTTIIWPNGAPQKCCQDPVMYPGVGAFTRMDWQPASGPSNGAWTLANNDFQDVSRAGPWTTSSRWGNTAYKLLGHFYDVTWRTNLGPTADIFWFPKMTGQDYYGYIDYKASGKTDVISAINNMGTVYNLQSNTTQNSSICHFPAFTRAGNGMGTVAYLYTGMINTDRGGMSQAQNSLYIQKNDGVRSIDIQWFYHDDAYSDLTYKVNQNGVNNSVLDAFNGLMVYVPTKTLTYSATKATLTNTNAPCTRQELEAIEYRVNGTFNYKFNKLNAAVYLLAPGYYYVDDPTKDQKYGTLGVTFCPVSRSFVFAGKCPTKNYVYTTAAHEMGHTFGFTHFWSNCRGTGNCANGDLMSYSQTMQMTYNADCKHWFAEAPWNWVHPRWGSQQYNNTLYPDMLPNQLIDWVAW